MENTDLLTNKRTLEKDPQYFGAYLNMARHNVFLINNHLAEKFEISKINNEEHIANSFFTNEIRKKPNHVFSFLTRFLPIAKVFDTDQLPKSEQDDLNSQEKTGKDITKLSKELKLCFKELNSFRNDYSHYYSTKNETNRKIIIEKDLSDFLKNNYQRAIEYSKKRFAGIFEEKHFNLAKEIELVSQDNKITEKGLVFFICLFLDRENAFKFINKIVGFKGTHLPEFKATREVFLAFCVKLPHDKFISDNPEQAFALDMLNELNRCPSILFDALPENLKTHFLPTLNKPEVQNIEENSLSEDLPEENYNDYIQSITKRIRYKDRFPYFALKFLDSTELSSKIRFQINLGKYQIDQYEKDFSGEKEKRAIVEDAKAFGRLDDFFNKEKETEKKINKKMPKILNLSNLHLITITILNKIKSVFNFTQKE